MSEIGRNINGAYFKGYDLWWMDRHPWDFDPYKAKHMTRAFRAGWEQARKDYRKRLAEDFGQQREVA